MVLFAGSVLIPGHFIVDSPVSLSIQQTKGVPRAAQLSHQMPSHHTLSVALPGPGAGRETPGDGEGDGSQAALEMPLEGRDTSWS